MRIVRKATGKTLAQVATIEATEPVLRGLPIGVYSIEDNDGNEVSVATVRRASVHFAVPTA